jgi:hypothetical protein
MKTVIAATLIAGLVSIGISGCSEQTKSSTKHGCRNQGEWCR